MHSFTPRFAILVAAALVALWVMMPAHIFPLYSDSSIPVTIAETLGTHGEADTYFYSTASAAAAAAAAAATAAAHPSSAFHSHASGDSPEGFAKGTTDRQTPSPAEIYFDQAFSLRPPEHEYDFPALRRQCERTTWKTRRSGDGAAAAGRTATATATTRAAVYLECEGIYLGLTSVISQVKSCLRMAIDAGAGVILPKIPLRDADNLLSYNQGNPAAERAFGDWFDERHLVEAMAGACPGLDVVTPREVEAMGVRAAPEDRWFIDVHAARFFRERDGYFWAGKPFGAFFDEEFARLRKQHERADQNVGKDKDKDKDKDEDEKEGEAGAGGAQAEGELQRREVKDEAAQEWRWEEGRGPVVVGMRADFELFNVANDPTGHDRHVWDDLGRALRFLREPRAIVDRLLRQIGGGGSGSGGLGGEAEEQQQQEEEEERPFFAVHFRGEGDNMWASADEQIRVDLDALDRAWATYGSDPALAAAWGGKKPPVYLACGDEGSLNAFVEAGRMRGWEITSKYGLTEAMGDTQTHNMIEALPFDFQAIIDLGMLVRSYFFIGIMGSAFSYTTSNLRDPLTRYRGSSFEVWDDGGARTHMFPNADRNGDATMEKYACCL